jgi:hypothetical protein
MKLWEALKAMEDGYKVRRTTWEPEMFVYKNNGEYYKADESEWEAIWVAPEDEWEFYDSRKDVNPFFRKLYKAINDLGPEYQRMLDSNESCNGDNCGNWELAKLCIMFDEIYTMLEHCNETYKLNKDELIRKL